MCIGIKTTQIRENIEANRADAAKVANCGPLLGTEYTVEYNGVYTLTFCGAALSGLYFHTANHAVEYLRNAGRINCRGIA
jgi:hypothetical protein